MGLILDTGILIASERRGESIDDILLQIRASYAETDIAISTVTVVELTHGIFRQRTKRSGNGGASSRQEPSSPSSCIPSRSRSRSSQEN